MRVFRCFFQILKRKKGYIFMYLGIFFSISLAMSMQGKESEKSFEKEKISFCLFDEDHSEISEGLAAFLKSENNWVEVADDEELIPESILQDREKQRLMREIIDNLTEMQRLCVIGFYYNEQSIAEIAKELEIPINTVKSHLNRAKGKIKEAVMELDEKRGTRLYGIAWSSTNRY